MSYVALYRVWRPSRWEDVVNQSAVIRILRNALTENKVSHAYLFSGPRGTGKTTVARLLAKAVNCQSPDGAEPCNSCPACVSVAEGTSVDVIEIDAASNRGIDEMRSLRESVRYVPVMGRFKVYIIDEVHMLTQEAFNALLKTLEEPPEHVIFILATTAPHKIPVTITSRCQRMDFRRLSIGDITGQLRKVLSNTSPETDLDTSKNALALVARSAQGSMRDALSILDLCLTYGEGVLVEDYVREILGETQSESMGRLFKAFSSGDIKTILEVVREMSDRGKDMGELSLEIGNYCRDILLVKPGGQIPDLGRPDDETREMRNLGRSIPNPTLISILDATARAASLMRTSDDPRLALEVSLLGVFLSGETSGKITAERTQAPAPTEPQKPDAAVSAPAPKPGPVKKSKPDPVELPQVPVIVDPEDVSIETIRALWHKLLVQLQKSKKALTRAYLLPAEPWRLEDKEVVLGYPKGYITHMEQIMTPAHKDVVELCLSDIIGHKITITAEVRQEEEFGSDGNDASLPGDGAGETSSRVTDSNGGSREGRLHPLVEAAVNLVGGKIVSQGEI